MPSNLLFGKFLWKNCDDIEIEIDAKDCISIDNFGLFTDRISILKNTEQNIFYSKEDHIICSLMGYILNLHTIKEKYAVEGVSDVEIIAKAFLIRDTSLFRELNGVYSGIIYNLDSKKGYVFQDEYGSNLPLYFIDTGNGFVFSSSLKILLKNVSLKRELDLRSVRAFIDEGRIIPAHDTLIKGIKKLIPGTYLLIDHQSGTAQIKPLEKKAPRVSRWKAKRNLLNTIVGSINRLYKDTIHNKDVFMALSGGFDSNFMLHALKEMSANHIKAITIGGGKISEIDKAVQIAGYYSNVDSITKTVDSKALENLPDIIWRLEGYVCERGIFLQYGLAEMLEIEKANGVFLAEGADQQMDYYEDISPRDFFRIFHRARPGKKYLEGRSTLNYVLKKSGLILNSVSCQGVYPYLDSNVNVMAKALKRLIRNKKYFKKQFKRIVRPEIGTLVGKKGGSTDLGYLFLGASQDTVKAILTSEFISKSIGNMLDIERVIRNYKHIDDDKYVRMNLLLLVYIFVFNELFITGKYDSCLDDKKMTLSLQELFSKAGQ